MGIHIGKMQIQFHVDGIEIIGEIIRRTQRIIYQEL